MLSFFAIKSHRGCCEDWRCRSTYYLVLTYLLTLWRQGRIQYLVDSSYNSIDSVEVCDFFLLFSLFSLFFSSLSNFCTF